MKIKVITEIGDDWILPAWGKNATIERTIAEDMIQIREHTESLFSQKGKKND